MKRNYNSPIIIGLGNPEQEFHNTFHNAGTLFIEHLGKLLETKILKTPPRRKFSFVVAPHMTLVKLETPMNISGEGAQDVVSYFKAKPEQYIIAHDDTDLALGTYKISTGRGSAGHKGIASVARVLPLGVLKRIRIGVRPPEYAEHEKLMKAGLPVHSRTKAGDFVLQHISAAHKKILDATFGNIAQQLGVISPEQDSVPRRIRTKS